MFSPNEHVLTLDDVTFPATFGENRSRNVTVRVLTDRHSDTRCDRDKLNLQPVQCCRL